jgi:deoxyribodipyrimidine photolyase
MDRPECVGRCTAPGVALGETYPAPIVDPGAARDRALAAYERAVG